MSFQGMIEDVAVADVMQLIRLGGHSGTLAVHNGREEAFIGFERGRIVSAWNPRSLRLGELLVAAGALDEGTLARALEAQNTERPHRSIGQILVRMQATTPEAIRDVMAREIERVVGEVFIWKTGTFEFVIDDLTPLLEVTRFTGAPKVDLDTQTVLMDVLRRMADAVDQSQSRPAEPDDELAASEVSGVHVRSGEVGAMNATTEPPVATDAAVRRTSSVLEAVSPNSPSSPGSPSSRDSVAAEVDETALPDRNRGRRSGDAPQSAACTDGTSLVGGGLARRRRVLAG